MDTKNINPKLIQEVKLYVTSRERERYENMADLYGLITTLQHLEKAYIWDCITSKEYTAACSKYLVQFKVAFKQVQSDEFPDVNEFIAKYRLDCPAAMVRIHEGRPVTIKDDKGNVNKFIADIVSMFITLMDKLRLDIKATDEIHPDLRDLIENINRLTLVPDSWLHTERLSFWQSTLMTMQASDELNDSQVRQLLFDLESSYASFNNLLHSQ